MTNHPDLLTKDKKWHFRVILIWFNIIVIFFFLPELEDNTVTPGVIQVITLDMGLLVAGTKYRGEFEERLKKLMEEVKQSDEIILFIDEVHTLIGAGAAEGAIDAANILKPALARGELQVQIPHAFYFYITFLSYGCVS